MNLELAREAVALLRNDGGLPFDAAPAEAIPGSGDAPARKRIAVVARSPTTPRTSSATGPAAPAKSAGCPTVIRAA